MMLYLTSFLLSSNNVSYPIIDPSPIVTYSQGSTKQCEYNINPQIKPEEYQMDDKYYICNQLIQQTCTNGSLSKIPKFPVGSSYAQAGCQFYDLKTIETQCQASNRDLTPEAVRSNAPSQSFLNPYTNLPSVSSYNQIKASDNLSTLCEDTTKTRIFILEQDSEGLKKLLASLPADFYSSDKYSLTKISINDLQKAPLKISFNRIGAGTLILPANKPCDVNQSTWAAYNRIDLNSPLKNGATSIDTQDIQVPEDFLKLVNFSIPKQRSFLNSHCFNKITINNTTQDVAVFFPLGRFKDDSEASRYISSCTNTSLPTIMTPVISDSNSMTSASKNNSTQRKIHFLKRAADTTNDDVYSAPPLPKKDNKKGFSARSLIDFIQNIFTSSKD